MGQSTVILSTTKDLVMRKDASTSLGMTLSHARHSRESGNPYDASNWTPAVAGVTAQLNMTLPFVILSIAKNLIPVGNVKE